MSKFIPTIVKDIWDKAVGLATIAGMATMIGGFFQNLGFVQIFVSTLGAFAFTLYIVSQWKIHNLKFPKRDTREDRAYNVLDTYFSKKSIRIIDFINSEALPIIKNKLFEDCKIYGPAILVKVGTGNNHLDDIRLNGIESIDDMLYQIEDGRKMNGVVGMDGCTFRRCEFTDIGIMGDKNDVELFKKIGLKRGGITK